MISVSPLGSTLVVVFCSKLFKSWARAAWQAIATASSATAPLQNEEKGLLCIHTPLALSADRCPALFKAIAPESPVDLADQFNALGDPISQIVENRGLVTVVGVFPVGCGPGEIQSVIVYNKHQIGRVHV